MASSFLLVLIDRVICPITSEVLHQVFDPYGWTERIFPIEKSDGVLAVVQYHDRQNAASALKALHGRNIYDGCCRMDIRFYGPCPILVYEDDEDPSDLQTSCFAEFQPEEEDIACDGDSLEVVVSKEVNDSVDEVILFSESDVVADKSEDLDSGVNGEVDLSVESIVEWRIEPSLQREEMDRLVPFGETSEAEVFTINQDHTDVLSIGIIEEPVQASDNIWISGIPMILSVFPAESTTVLKPAMESLERSKYQDIMAGAMLKHLPLFVDVRFTRPPAKPNPLKIGISIEEVIMKEFNELPDRNRASGIPVNSRELSFTLVGTCLINGKGSYTSLEQLSFGSNFLINLSSLEVDTNHFTGQILDHDLERDGKLWSLKLNSEPYECMVLESNEFLELTEMKDNSQLRELLIEIASKSVILIENINYSSERMSVLPLVTQAMDLLSDAINSLLSPGCHCDIGHGNYLGCLGTFFHPECLRCGVCHHPITEHEFPLSKKDAYHKSCSKELTRPRCEVCHQFIPSNGAGLIEYRCHPFWSQKYYPSHEHDNTTRCCSCERLESWNAKYNSLGDGQSLCVEYMASSIIDIRDCQPLYHAIRDYYEGMNMRPDQQIPMLLVESQVLNEAIVGEKSGYHHMTDSRGLRLSKEQTASSILRGPRIGGQRLIGMRTHTHKLIRKREVTAILVLYGLPRLLTGVILTLELMHGWLRFIGYHNLNLEVAKGMEATQLTTSSPSTRNPPTIDGLRSVPAVDQDLMDRSQLRQLLRHQLQHSPRFLQETCMPTIRFVASSPVKTFIPYTQRVLELMKHFMTFTKDEALRVRAMATELTGMVTVSVGRIMMELIMPPFFEATIYGLALEYSDLLEKFDDLVGMFPDLNLEDKVIFDGLGNDRIGDNHSTGFPLTCSDKEKLEQVVKQRVDNAELRNVKSGAQAEHRRHEGARTRKTPIWMQDYAV